MPAAWGTFGVSEEITHLCKLDAVPQCETSQTGNTDRFAPDIEPFHSQEEFFRAWFVMDGDVERTWASDLNLLRGVVTPGWKQNVAGGGLVVYIVHGACKSL